MEGKNHPKQGEVGSRKQKHKQLEKAVGNYIWDEIGKLKMANLEMFNLKATDGQLTEEKKKAITVYMDSAEHLKNAEDVMNMDFKGFSLVHSVSVDCPIDPEMKVADLKLDVFGPKEDLFYSTFPRLIKNIRRGNTVLSKGGQTVIGRKGLMKFFDLRLSHVSKEERDHLGKSKHKESVHIEKNYILGGALKAMADGYQVEVYKTLKANGENVQISYSSFAQAWLISSKNVCLLARSPEDLEKYKEGEMAQRFSFAVKMGDVWFNKLAELGDQAKELQKILDGRTLIGEYIGSQEHQHLVKYTRVSIIFYALVENNSDKSCVPCGQAFGLFKKFGLDMVHIQSLGSFKEFYPLCDQLEKTFKDVAKSPIAQDEEGNVLYFVKKSPDGQQELEVLSLAKLKTLEYRLFRKMREKLRYFFKEADFKGIGDYKKVVKSFKKESEELLEGGKNELPQPLDYYVNILSHAHEFITKHPEQREKLQGEYVTFSEGLLEYIHKEVGESNVSNFFASDILDVQHKIDFGDKDVEMKCEEPEEPEEPQMQIIEEKKENPEEVRRGGAAVVPQVLFIVPFATPNSGKSTIWKNIQEVLTEKFASVEGRPIDWTFRYISSDGIRGEETQKLVAKGMGKDAAFEKCRKVAVDRFKKGQIQLVKESANLGKNEIRVVYFDKNHPPNGGAQQATALIDENIPAGVTYQKLYLTPLISGEYLPDYPFSFQFLAQCLHNGINRDVHETLDNSNIPKLFGIQFMFLSMNKRAIFDNDFRQRQGFDNILPLPMTNERLEISDSFKKAMVATLNEIPARDLIDQANPSLLALIQAVKDNAAELGKYPTTEFQRERITFSFNQIISYVKELPPPKKTGFQGPLPVYLGIDLAADNAYFRKLTALFSDVKNTLAEELGTANDLGKDLEYAISTLKNQKKGEWKMPNSYHVTQLFIGGNASKRDNPIVQNYQPGSPVEVVIDAVLYVPGRILTGICHPKAEVENKFPHLTLMIGGKWKPVNSNSLLLATCEKGLPFKDAYWNSEAAKEQSVTIAEQVGVNLSRNFRELVPKAYFIQLSQARKATFQGRTKCFN